MSKHDKNYAVVVGKAQRYPTYENRHIFGFGLSGLGHTGLIDYLRSCHRHQQCGKTNLSWCDYRKAHYIFPLCSARLATALSARCAVPRSNLPDQSVALM